MSKVTLEELKEHCIKMIQKAKRLGFPEDSKSRQKHEIFLQLIKEHEQRRSLNDVLDKIVFEICSKNTSLGTTNVTDVAQKVAYVEALKIIDKCRKDVNT